MTTESNVEKVYTEAEVTAKLEKELPHWFLENGWIRRKYKTSGWKATLMVVNTVGHLAEAAWHHPDLTVSYAFVIVKLCTHDKKGITDKDFELAAKIESVIAWQPALEAKPDGTKSALEGTPNDDVRFKYIKYD
jgi:4a-hydroxytetrahydrobiopterin dehydratase